MKKAQNTRTKTDRCATKTKHLPEQRTSTLATHTAWSTAYSRSSGSWHVGAAAHSSGMRGPLTLRLKNHARERRKMASVAPPGPSPGAMRAPSAEAQRRGARARARALRLRSYMVLELRYIRSRRFARARPRGPARRIQLGHIEFGTGKWSV
eukprot:COSAG02_NODE_9750_length_2121_cov_1.481207_2_plen_152_part_00